MRSTVDESRHYCLLGKTQNVLSGWRVSSTKTATQFFPLCDGTRHLKKYYFERWECNSQIDRLIHFYWLSALSLLLFFEIHVLRATSSDTFILFPFTVNYQGYYSNYYYSILGIIKDTFIVSLELSLELFKYKNWRRRKGNTVLIISMFRVRL